MDHSPNHVLTPTPKSAKNLQHLTSACAAVGSTATAGGGTTYDNQNGLPRLPIPAIDDTLSRFRARLTALQTAEEREESKRICDEFLAHDGPILQQALREYEADGVTECRIGSYVEEFWNESYLSPDTSVVLNLNPFFLLETHPDPKIANDQLKRAASLCFAALKMASTVRHQKLTPDTFRGKPLCMDQFKALFGSSRQPKMDGDDDVDVYNDSSHVIVQYANQLYYFTGLWPNTGHVALDEADILDNLRAIASHETERQAGIGVLTSQSRSKWAEAREELCKTESNVIALRIIDSALFVLVLDDFVPADINEAAANVLHGTNRLKDDDGTGNDAQIGTCLNRWYDKLQLIVCRDGTSGLIFEHSIIDGHTALRFASDVYAETLIAFAESIVDLIHGPGRVTHVLEAVVERSTRRGSGEMVDVRPRKLVFELSDRLLDAIYYAETALCDEISANDTYVLEFREFGKRLVVGNKISPDAFVQMMILLAYYRLYGKADCMYEPALTKQFFHGRTEAIRGTTPQAVQFCQTFLCKTATRDEKLEALRVATTEHSRLTAESSMGLGVDRHLFALKCIAKRMGMPTPALFESAAWKALGHTVLSTSNCGNPSLRLFGFGPVVPDGFGIGYIIKDHGLSFSVCSKHRQTKRYVDKLRLSLMDLQELLEPISNVSVHHHHPSVGIQNNNQSSSSRPRDDDQLEQNGYGDIYGENHVPAAIPAAIGMERRSVSSGGQYFSRIQERSESVSLLAVTDLGVEVLDSSKKLEI